MDTSLAGRTILIVEDEPVIALSIVDIFRAAGASIEVACSLTAAHELVECGEVRQNVATFNACASWEHLVKADRHILEGQARIEA